MDSITDVTEQVHSDRKALVEKLVDKNNPEMVTLVVAPEVDDISLLQSVAQDIDIHTKVLGMERSFLTLFIQNNLIIRTSIQGNRSKQIVDTVQGVLREEIISSNPLSAVGKKLLGT